MSIGEPVGPDQEAAAQAVFGEQLARIRTYIEILGSTGVDWGLVGPREADRLWTRHIWNSAALAGLVTPGATVVDVGSGAGLPGIPLALARPDLRVTLLEPLLRRVTFLQETVDVVGLGDQVEVVRGRAEDHHATYDAVVSRALAPLPRLVGWSVPLMRAGGSVLALKGRSAATEIIDAARDLRRLGLTAEVVEARADPRTEPATVVRVRRA